MIIADTTNENMNFEDMNFFLEQSYIFHSLPKKFVSPVYLFNKWLVSQLSETK